MLHINDLVFRIEGKLIFDGATVAVPAGHKVGIVGRNGVGKTTLLRLINGELSPDDGGISMPRTHRIGYVAQEAPGTDVSLIDWVLSADSERGALLAEAETAIDPHRIAEIQIRLTDIRAHAAPARAAQILAGLGFDETAQRRPCHAFSGGWRMRVALAAVLFLEPEVLLLDEPTNYLDMEGTLWLESYLRSYPETVLIVSHDRDLLNTVVGSILHVEKGRLTLYTGGYDQFEETRRERQRLELKLKKKQDDERRRIQAFIDRFRAKASKAKQAQSRVKALARMQPIAEQVDEHVAPFLLPNPEKMIASPILRLENAAVGYDNGPPVLTNLDLRIDHDDRIALLGQNGNGKSTFAKLISGKLAPTHGAVRGAAKIEVGYFAQHQLDELNPTKSPFDYMVELLPEATEAQRRARLGMFGFGVDKADTKCANLSGGEKARLLLAITAFHKPHLLILDEPTNHLDVDSREALIHALMAYEGAVVIISHDRHLVAATADRLWLVKGGSVEAYDGDIDSYRSELLAERSGRARSNAASESSSAGNGGGEDKVALQSRAEQRRAAAERRAEIAPLKKALEAADMTVTRLANEISKLDVILADADLYIAEPERVQKLAVQRGQLAQQLATAEETWLEAGEAYEQAKAAFEN
ncbi:MAG: ABC-F family ATP-binding cassette domain-containing protein [Hyphomicrobiaceae bacterium]|nr:ABC-F family ATP-binding cassette domain-containing protein [Hyphomicrobiaceae bacterium]